MTYGDRLTVMQIGEHKFTLNLKKDSSPFCGDTRGFIMFLKNYFFLPTLGEWLVIEQLIWRSSERGLGNGRGEKIDHNLHNQ